ncbi:MAG TPA: lasso peptide biosynthesis B2 protein [Vicinamibacterales bacterium]|jgi:hypothetical protein|nr:lasso peptide biosynthesis B2 protein [Vicinamibacterales bacterium]
MGPLARSALRLTPPERRVALEAAALLPLAALAVRFCPPARAARVMDASCSTAAGELAPRRIAAIADAVLTLAHARCLTKTLILKRMLSRRGVQTEAVVGVARDESQLAAHAWLEWNGEVLIGAGSREYAPLWRSGAARP